MLPRKISGCRLLINRRKEKLLKKGVTYERDKENELKPRAPIITVMGLITVRLLRCYLIEIPTWLLVSLEVSHSIFGASEVKDQWQEDCFTYY